jgi:hypothetical protein
VSPSDPNWSPLADCDSNTANSSVDVGADGVATFPANDANFGTFPFKGLSPTHQFNCLAPSDPPLNNGKPSYVNCHVRITTDLINKNALDSFITMQLPTATPRPGSAVIGGCSGFALLAKTHVGTSIGPMSDVTQDNVSLPTSMLKDNATNKAPVAGSCTIGTREGDPSNPAGGPLTLTPKSETGKLLGNASCAPASVDPGNTATHMSWPFNGKLTFPMVQTDALGHQYKIQIQLEVLRQANVQAAPDVYDVRGVVSAGAGTGATVSGSIWIDPVTLLPRNSASFMASYALDSTNAQRCNDATSGNASVSTVMIGGGGATQTSLEGNPAYGLQFTTNG